MSQFVRFPHGAEGCGGYCQCSEDQQNCSHQVSHQRNPRPITYTEYCNTAYLCDFISQTGVLNKHHFLLCICFVDALCHGHVERSVTNLINRYSYIPLDIGVNAKQDMSGSHQLCWSPVSQPNVNPTQFYCTNKMIND